MNLTTKTSLLVARNVVNHFEMLLDSTPMKYRDIDTSGVTLMVGSFQNGREQGLSISAFGVKLANGKYGSTTYYISEDRSSDSIVVYVGEWVNNSGDSGWAEVRSYFNYGKYAEAAEYIQSDIFEKLQAQSEPA